MIDTIYIEAEVVDHTRTQSLLQRFKKANHIVVDRYAEIFNSHKQNFRLQKQNPSLILAHKHNQRVLTTPSQYETGGGANYYFSHMLNCLYDCRYCFLQGMFQSANYLLFVNYEDFMDDIRQVSQKHRGEPLMPWFFSGYDCDSLALEPVTGFADYFLGAFETMPNAVLELRTKSTQIRSLLDRPAQANVVVAFSLSPDPVANAVEHGAPAVTKRLGAMRKLQQAGWRVGARLDPLIWHDSWQESYGELIQEMELTLEMAELDSVTLGGFRLPRDFYKKMKKLYPEHWLFSAGLDRSGSMVGYYQEIEETMFDFLQQRLAQAIPTEKLFSYPSYLAQQAAGNTSAVEKHGV